VTAIQIALTGPNLTGGACAQDPDPDVMFPHPTDHGGNAHAKSICRACDVMGDCAAWALDARERHGVWGGLTERDRESIWRRADRARQKQDAAARALTPAQEDAAFLLEQGETRDGAAARLGVTPKTFTRTLWRARQEATT
jgi:WhiB family redox-sensing transcriptional regulator